MQSLASEVLKAEKRKCRFWRIATITVLVIAIVEFMLITKGIGIGIFL